MKGALLLLTCLITLNGIAQSLISNLESKPLKVSRNHIAGMWDIERTNWDTLWLVRIQSTSSQYFEFNKNGSGWYEESNSNVDEINAKNDVHIEYRIENGDTVGLSAKLPAPMFYMTRSLFHWKIKRWKMNGRKKMKKSKGRLIQLDYLEGEHTEKYRILKLEPHQMILRQIKIITTNG